MPNIVSPELLHDELKAVVQAGGYPSEEEAIRHALEVLLAANDSLRVSTAIELYRQGKVTLSRAAEIAQLELELFKEKLAEKNVPLPIDETPEDLQAGTDFIGQRRKKP